MASTLPQLTRDEVAHLVSLGHVLVLKRRQIFRLNSWLALHPGGHLAILHFVGRDAANEIDAYHCDATLKMMRSFLVAEVAAQDWSEELTGWKPLLPPVQASKTGAHGRIADYSDVSRDWKADLQHLKEGAATATQPPALLSVAELEPPVSPAQVDPAKQYRVSKAWEDLHTKLVDAGVYRPSPAWNYRVDLLRYFGLFLAFLWVFLQASQTCEYAIKMSRGVLITVFRALLRCCCAAGSLLASSDIRSPRCCSRRDHGKLPCRQSHRLLDRQLVWRTQLWLVGRCTFASHAKMAILRLRCRAESQYTSLYGSRHAAHPFS